MILYSGPGSRSVAGQSQEPGMPGFSTHLLKNRRPPEIAAFMASLRGRDPYKRSCDELKSIFVHVPKAAGTSVALSLFAIW